MSNPNPNVVRRSSHLTALRGGKDPAPPQLRAAGAKPSADMLPGVYVATCEDAFLERKGRGYSAVLQFRILDGPHGVDGGTSLRGWISISGEAISHDSRYGRACAIALGRPIRPDEDLPPALVF